jgi:hypothetical protein
MATPWRCGLVGLGLAVAVPPELEARVDTDGDRDDQRHGSPDDQRARRRISAVVDRVDDREDDHGGCAGHDADHRPGDPREQEMDYFVGCGHVTSRCG